MEIIKTNKFQSSLSPSFDNVQIIVGRVIDIILDDKHPEFKRLGEWDSLGTIFFNEANKIQGTINLKNLPYAKPLYSNKKYYPLKNEIVCITSFINFESQNNISLTQYYYSDIINIWNHPHHNALPLNYNKDERINNSYNQKSIGNTESSKEESTKIDLGKEFIEKNNIKPLLPKEGDYIIESRFGSSIRFGSDKNGNPITIIRNGQNPILNDKGWIPIKEDINNDSSSIYFSNGENIPIEVASTNLKSFNLISIKTTNSKLQTTEENKVNNQISSQQNLNSFTQSFTESINLNQPINIITSSFNLNDDFIISEELFQESDWEKFDIPSIDNTFNPSPNGILGSVTQKELTDINGKKISFKTIYNDLPFVQAVKRFYPKGQMVNEIKLAISDFNIEIQKAVWIIFYMENSGNTFNYNGWGVQTDAGRRWIDPEKAIVNQIGLREGKTGKYRSFAGFKDLKSAIRFVAYAFKRKNISILTPDLAKVYAQTWVGNSIATNTLNILIKEADTYFK